MTDFPPPEQPGTWEYIRQHKVVQWTVAYAAVAFGLLQSLDIIANTYDWPRLAMRIITFLMIVGLPAVALLAWHHGHKRRQRIVPTEAAALAALLLVAGAGLWFIGRAPEPAVQAAGSFSPPPRSVAVLAFANMSGDAKDEYFSDGLSEELLNTLVRVDELRVAARTSSFSFKGTAADIPTVGRRLNVGAVLEGSVRKANDRVRITAQLINAVDGFHLWSATYDRDMSDIFALQTEIATAVAAALKVTLLGETKEKLTVGGTNSAAALDAYLRGRETARHAETEQDFRAVVAAYEEAVRLDPSYALARAALAKALLTVANDWSGDPATKLRRYAEARKFAEEAVTLAPTSGAAYGALAEVIRMTTLDFAAVEAALRRAVTLEPGNADLQAIYGLFEGTLGRPDALDAVTRATVLDPIEPRTHRIRASVLVHLRRYDEARVSAKKALLLADSLISRDVASRVELAAGHYADAAVYCEPHSESWLGQSCLAIAYQHMGRKSEALAMLARLQKEQGDPNAYQYAEIYAQWGDSARSLEWLETALRLKDSGLSEIRVNPLLDSIRDTPGYRSIVAELKFPDAAATR